MQTERLSFPSVASVILLCGDWLALVIFVFAGQSDHATVDAVNPILGLLPDFIAFALPWAIAAWLIGALNPPGSGGRKKFFAHTLNAWLVAALFGLLLRAILLGRATIPTSFIIAATCFGGLFLFAWRIVFVIANHLAVRKK